MEIWSSIEGYSNYEVSDLGRVRSFRIMKKLRKGTTKEVILKQNIIKGYHNVTFYRDGIRKNLRVSRLVAIAFIGNPHGKPEVNHKDGDKSNNRVDNLEWSTSSENTQHAYDTGLMNAPIYRGTFDKPVLAIKDLSIIQFSSRRECARELGIPFGSMGKLVDSGKDRNGYSIYSE